ncbi:MAG TPA: hypothetical protein VK935_05840 [Actinomycetospora sp.]|nr:hypothetical protein [Actinomycetospora sp.]
MIAVDDRLAETSAPTPPRAPRRCRRAASALGALGAAAVLVLGAACSSAPQAPPPAPTSVPAPSGSPAAPSGEDDAADAELDAPVLAYGATHVFGDGNAVTVSGPVAGPAVAGAPFPRSLEVTVTVRNGTPAPEDLSRFAVDVTVPEDREAPSVDDGLAGILAPGEERAVPLRFALPDPGPTQVTVEVAKADQTAAGEDVPGSDEVPGSFVSWEGQV